MRFVDPSPSSSPNIANQVDALQKGLGRAMQWALAGKLDDQPLLDACLHDQRHDMQIESPRGSWLWQLIKTVKTEQRFSDPLLRELKELPDVHSANQLCQLGYFYATIGEEAFRQRLYEIVEQAPVSDFPGLGEPEILRLDGDDAFVFAARVRGHRLMDREWDWDDDALIREAVEQLGEAQVLNLLENATDASVKRFHECWLYVKQRKSEQPPYPEHKDRMRSITVDEIIVEAETQRTAVGCFRGWGMYASVEDLNIILERLWSAEDPNVIVRFLWVFSGRALPTFDARLIEFCHHSDEKVRHRAFSALQMNSHPLIREYALTNIRQGLRDSCFGGLFIRNYSTGDEDRMLQALELPADENELHWLLYSVIQVLENNNEADPTKLALVTYARTPCGECRFKAASILQSRGVVPDWMPAECRCDSDEETRKLFQD